MDTKNLFRADNLPDHVLTDITPADPEKPKNDPGNAANTGISEVPASDVFNTANKAANPAIFPQPGTDTPGNNTGLKTIPMSAGKLVSGSFATGLMDSLFPALTVWVAGMIGYEFSSKALKLSEKEKELITPAMQQYLDSINVTFNSPLQNLLFAIGAVYAAKVIEIIPTIEKKKPKPKNDVQKIVQKVEETQQKEAVRKTKIQQLHETVKSLPSYELQIKAIQDYRKGNKQDAVSYYNKNFK